MKVAGVESGGHPSSPVIIRHHPFGGSELNFGKRCTRTPKFMFPSVFVYFFDARNPQKFMYNNSSRLVVFLLFYFEAYIRFFIKF